MSLEKYKNLKYRYENFGGIISSEEPPFLAFVDRNYMKELNLPDSPLWKTKDNSVGLLSAPTEVHFSITNRCSVGCSHCYMDSGKPDEGEMNTSEMKNALEILSKLGVFHLALGGGEALERADLFEIAEYARKLNMVPNLTVSGMGITKEVAPKMTVFGQVNVSIDGLGNTHNVFRDNLFQNADKAIDFLKENKISTGINCVIGNKNFEQLEDVFKYAQNKKLNEIEFLRLKPSGRGKNLYETEKTTYEQNIQLVPLLSQLSDKYNIQAKIDCSFVPMFCYHNPPLEVLNSMATYGCEAGNILLGIRSNGQVSGCSFLKNSGTTIHDLPKILKSKSGELAQFNSWGKNAPAPCNKCKYLSLCKGGCHCVSDFVLNDVNAPDPDCPFVYEHNLKKKR